MFQREWFQHSSIAPEDCQEEVRRCATCWREASAEVKVAYSDKARFEQSLREEAARQPFNPRVGKPTLGNAAFDAASQLNHKSQKKVSLPRLVETYNRFANSGFWASSGLGLASADGCLKLEAIDLDSTAASIKEVIQTAFHEPVPEQDTNNFAQDPPGLHHHTCHQTFGHCRKKAHTALACKFVQNFNSFFGTGPLSSRWCVVILLDSLITYTVYIESKSKS